MNAWLLTIFMMATPLEVTTPTKGVSRDSAVLMYKVKSKSSCMKKAEEIVKSGLYKSKGLVKFPKSVEITYKCERRFRGQ